MGAYSGSSYIDGFRRRRAPGNETKVQEYKRVVYSCANLNANAVVGTPLRLYVKTSPGDSQSLLRKGKETKPLTSPQLEHLHSLPYLQKTLKSALNLAGVPRIFNSTNQ